MNRFLSFLHDLVMAVFLAAALSLVFTSTARAGELEAQGTHGVLRLSEAAGPCVDGAKAATWINNDQTRVPGCWRMVSADVVQVVFFDAGGMRVSTGSFRPARDA